MATGLLNEGSESAVSRLAMHSIKSRLAIDSIQRVVHGGLFDLHAFRRAEVSKNHLNYEDES